MDEDQKRLAEELLFAEKKKPSFAKRIFFGEFDSHTVFPFPESLTRAEEEEYVKKVESFAKENIDPDWIDRNAQIPDKVIKGLANLGVLGMTISKKYGGLGMSQRAYCRVEETLAGRCGSTALMVNAHQSIGVKSILLFGNDAQKKKWLPAITKGEQIAAFSLTEPNAGSDASGIETRAEYDPKRKVYILNGKKQWTTNGSIAGLLTVMAQVNVKGQDKVTAFLVTPDMPGFKITAEALEKVGMRGTRTTNLEFVNLEVPEENLLGPLGGGLRVCLTALDYGRTTFGAMCTGNAKFLLEKAVEHAKTRYQFKRPLAGFALVQQKIATISALTYAMDATTYLTAALIDENVEDIMLESAMLKVFASDSLWTILYETMQIYGGRSFFTDHPFERMMRDARLNMIGEGSNEVMRAFIGLVGMRDVGVYFKDVLESAKNPFGNASKVGVHLSQFMNRFKTPQVTVKSPKLKKEALALGKAVRRFGFAVVRVLKTYREEVIERQLELNRIATAAMAIYTTTAVLSKLDSDISSFKAQKDDLQIGQYYCHMAMKTLDQALNELFSNEDAEVRSLAKQITGVSDAV